MTILHYAPGTKVRMTVPGHHLFSEKGRIILTVLDPDAQVDTIRNDERREKRDLVSVDGQTVRQWWLYPEDLELVAYAPIKDAHEFSVEDIKLLQRAIENDSPTDRHEARMLLNAKLHPTVSHAFTVTIEAAGNYPIDPAGIQERIAANPNFTKVTVEPLTASTEGASA